MMTARAEYRLLLRQDNADARLTQMGRRVGLVTDERYDAYCAKREAIENERKRLGGYTVDMERANAVLEAKGQPALKNAVKADSLLTRQGVGYADLRELCGGGLDEAAALCLETEIRYAGYIEKQRRQVEKYAALEKKRLPGDIDYSLVVGLRLEAAAKLSAVRPETLGQAMRISGVSPADIAVLSVFLKK
jgi:NAD/FAD-utilizing enzyme apparently involved in cell division